MARGGRQCGRARGVLATDDRARSDRDRRQFHGSSGRRDDPKQCEDHDGDASTNGEVFHAFLLGPPETHPATMTALFSCRKLDLLPSTLKLTFCDRSTHLYITPYGSIVGMRTERRCERSPLWDSGPAGRSKRTNLLPQQYRHLVRRCIGFARHVSEALDARSHGTML